MNNTPTNNKKLSIALVRPNYQTHLITPILSLGYLSTYLKNRGYETKIIDALKLNISNNEIVPLCKEYDIVGINCLSAYYLEVVDLTKKLKAMDKLVILGGVHPSMLPESTLRDTGADYIVVGEGEQTLLELLEAIEKNMDTDLPGVYSKKTIIFQERQFIHNIDSLPFPDWEQMDPRTYPKAPHGAVIKNFPVAPIISTRGCPFKCKFCASPKFWKRIIRFRSPENVVSEIKLLIDKFKVREIHFEDDNLTLNKKHIENICKLILKNNLKISWACPNGIRADQIDLELLKLMKKSGCYYLAFGIESGNQQILDNISKSIDLKTIANAVTMAKNIGIITQGFFIFGLPGETKESIEKTIEFAKKIPLSRAQFLTLDVIPGSELYDELTKEGYKADWHKSSFHEITWRPATVSENDLKNAAPLAFKRFFLRPKQLFSLIKYVRPSQIIFLSKRIIDFNIIKAKRKKAESFFTK